MTLNGAIMQLVEMRENSMMPEVFKPYLDKVIETISECEEPSAQPTQLNTPNTLEALDCISRQKAIYAFDCTDELIVGGSANAQNVMNYINKVIGKIKALPSAQPEPQCIPVTKEQILQAGYEGREVRFHIGGRLFAIRELAQ